MGHEKRIVDAFLENEITKILVIDDVYDLPELEEIPGPLLDFLDDFDGQEACREAGVSDPVLTAAAKAANENNVDSDELLALMQALYTKFVETRDSRFDPGHQFETLKGATLDVLAPLIALLRKCGPKLRIELAGLKDGEQRYRDMSPQVVFLDYYLAQEAVGEGLTKAVVKRKARKASVDLLARLLEDAPDHGPAIVLMSSEQVKEEAQKFRQSVEEQGRHVLAIRFRFLQKDWVSKNGDELKIENEAADTLLDTSQGFVFGQILQSALKKWREGAENAQKALLKEIGSLEPKDFAYLFRFRLAAEGERMGDYLEWLFGENLRALVAEKVDWKDQVFPKLDDPNLSKGVEGAFDGPSTPIAKLFHRIRVDEHPSRERKRHALGDIFIKPKDKKLFVVITPDCDLVPRSNGKTKVTRLLTMSGELRSFDEESASADQFVIYKKKPYSIRWNPKELNTFPVSGVGSLNQLNGIEFLGTLRPLYAQEVQRQALTDLARIGLAVAPTMGVDASISVHLRVANGNGTAFQCIDINGKAMATVLLERGDAAKGHKVLLRRSFVHTLIDKLREVDLNTLAEEDRRKLTDFLKEKNEDQLITGFLTKGAAIKDKGPLGTMLAISNSPDHKKDAAWLQLLLTLSDEAMEELIHVDTMMALAERDDDLAEIAAKAQIVVLGPLA